MQMKNAIIICDYAFINGGAAKVAIQSAIGLAQNGINVIFFSAVGPIDENLNSKLKVICLNQHDLLGSESKLKGAFQGIWNIKAKKEFKKLLNKFDNKDTVIHIHGWTKALSSSIFKVAEERKFTIYVTLHDYFSICPNGSFYNYISNKICQYKPLSVNCIKCNCDRRNYIQKIYRVIRQLVQNKYVKNNKKIRYIFISENNRKVAMKWLSPNTNFIKLINPIELNKNSISLNINECNSYVYIGRLVWEKGADLFCEAIERLNLNGIVIGNGEIIDILKERYKKVKFVGWKNYDEISEYLDKARALIFPSRWYEGAPLTIVEALSFGVPCIVSDCTSAVEIINHNKNGYIFKTDDINDLCENIKKIENNDKLLEIKNNIKNTFDKEQYKIDNHISRLVKIYNEDN